MLAYKFRSPAQIEFALDILFNNRLYCSKWSELNDPMEGVYVYNRSSTDETDYSALLDDIHIEMERIRICSLSKTYDCHLLWAHYAAGFTGMAIEIDLPDDSRDVISVDYGGVFSYANIANDRISSDIAREILSSKYREWIYEQEVRILNSSYYYKLQSPIRRIIVGHRIDPSLLTAIRIICEKKGIPVYRTGIGDEGIDADHVPVLGERW